MSPQTILVFASRHTVFIGHQTTSLCFTSSKKTAVSSFLPNNYCSDNNFIFYLPTDHDFLFLLGRKLLLNSS